MTTSKQKILQVRWCWRWMILRHKLTHVYSLVISKVHFYQSQIRVMVINIFLKRSHTPSHHHTIESKLGFISAANVIRITYRFACTTGKLVNKFNQAHLMVMQTEYYYWEVGSDERYACRNKHQVNCCICIWVVIHARLKVEIGKLCLV